MSSSFKPHSRWGFFLKLIQTPIVTQPKMDARKYFVKATSEVLTISPIECRWVNTIWGYNHIPIMSEAWKRALYNVRVLLILYFVLTITFRHLDFFISIPVSCSGKEPIIQSSFNGDNLAMVSGLHSTREDPIIVLHGRTIWECATVGQRYNAPW